MAEQNRPRISSVLDGVLLPLKGQVHSLGVLFVTEVTLENQVAAVAQRTFDQFCQKLCPFLVQVRTRHSDPILSYNCTGLL